MHPPSSSPTARKRVVIVGAGFAGIEAARALATAPVDVTIIDRRNYHLFQPLLYQVATAELSPSLIAWPVRSLFRRQKNVRVLMMEIDAIDLAAGTVSGGGIAIGFDQLVLATGATHAYFGHDDWAPFAPGLKTIVDALTLRARLLSAFEQAELATDDAERRRLQTIAIVGGGATGVEIAGAVADLVHRTLTGEFHAIDPASTRIVLIEAGPRLLAAFAEDQSEQARRSLVALGVEVRTGRAVTACGADGILCGDTTLRAATVVWAAGVRASPAGRWLGAPVDRAGRVQVAPDLSVPGHPDLFVIGDTASILREIGTPVPGLAAAAKQMGKDVGRRLAARAGGKAEPGPFRYVHQGDLATIGRKSALVAIGNLRLSGVLGWLFWGIVHIAFLIGARSRTIVLMNWVWSVLTARRGERFIPDRPPRRQPAPGDSRAFGQVARPSEKNGATSDPIHLQNLGDAR